MTSLNVSSGGTSGNNNATTGNSYSTEVHEDIELSPEMWNNPDLQGQLTKQGHFVKNWKLRWFILQHNRLFYFKVRPTKYTREPTGFIILKGATANINTKINKNPCIEIEEKATGTMYYMYSQSKESTEQWCNAIRDATLKKDTTPNSMRHHLHIDHTEFNISITEIISPENPQDRYDCDEFEKIGQGGLAKVYCAVDKLTKQKVAIKSIRVTARNLKYILPELMNHKTCHHANVVDFLNAYYLSDRQQIWVVLEFMPGGSLADFLEPIAPKFESTSLPENQIAYISKEVLKALDYIHSMNKIHRDIKSDNVLLGDVNDYTTIKLADFGFAVHLTEKR